MSRQACRVEIVNIRGLHARASAKFVKAASAFQSQIHVIRNDTEVDARSIMGLLMLGAAKGAELQIVAQGPDAEAAIEALSALVANRFDEDI